MDFQFIRRRPKALVAAIVLALVVLVFSVSALALYKPQFVYEVSMDGKILGHVESLDEYRELLDGIYEQAEKVWNCDLQITQELSARRVLKWQPQNNPDLVSARVEQGATYITNGWAITVNGNIIAWVDAKDTAEELLDAVNKEYAPTAKNRVLLDVTLLDTVKIERQPVEPEDITDRDTALNLLLLGQKESSVYVVRSGDTLSGIASRHGSTVPSLRQANNLRSDTIQVGQVLNLEYNSSQIRVKTVEELRVTERISYTTQYRTNPDLSVRGDTVIQAGSNGSRDVVYRVELINGQEVKRVKTDVVITRQPTTKIVMPGRGYWPAAPTGPFRFPLNTGRLTDPFGHVASYRNSVHTGQDIAAPRGTPIYAAADGVVTRATYNAGGYGYYVIIDHQNGYKTLYAHCTRFASGIRPGQRVVRGQIIAYVGNTGNSRGAHLHWEVIKNDSRVNPMQYFR